MREKRSIFVTLKRIEEWRCGNPKRSVSSMWLPLKGLPVCEPTQFPK